VLVCYSDGITERTNAAGEFYGSERLRLLVAANHALSAGEIVARILEDAEQFSGGEAAGDDVTIVAMKVR